MPDAAVLPHGPDLHDQSSRALLEGCGRPWAAVDATAPTKAQVVEAALARSSKLQGDLPTTSRSLELRFRIARKIRPNMEPEALTDRHTCLHAHARTSSDANKLMQTRACISAHAVAHARARNSTPPRLASA